MLRFPRVLAALFVVGCPVSLFAQTHSDTLLTVGGDVDQPYVLSAAEFAKLPHTSVRAEGHDTKMSKFEGVLLADLLRRAGVTILLSDRRDEAPTETSEGPLRVVATGDKRFARWVRQVTSLT